MPGLKQLLFRRTLAATTVSVTPSSSSSPLSILSPLPTINGVTTTTTTTTTTTKRVFCVSCKTKSTLAKNSVCLRRVSCAHVNITTNNNKNILLFSNNNKNNNIVRFSSSRNKRLYIPSSSSSSSSTNYSSSSFEEERESVDNNNNKGKDPMRRVPVTLSTPNSTSSHCSGVAEMGHKQNGVVVDGNRDPNGVVSSSKDQTHKQQCDDEQQQEEMCTKLLTLPTVLTLARVAAIPVFIATFYVNSWWGTAATTTIFIAAAITDWLDGYLARKMRQGTAFGAFLDPVADKLMVAATLVLLCSKPPETALFGDASWLFPVPAIAIIGREITMSAVREWAASQDTKLLQAVAVNNLGKWKTATQMTALTILVATRDSSLGGPGALVTSGVALLYISAGLAVWSLVVYMRKISKVLLR